jgi:hypothetical protein
MGFSTILLEYDNPANGGYKAKHTKILLSLFYYILNQILSKDCSSSGAATSFNASACTIETRVLSAKRYPPTSSIKGGKLELRLRGESRPRN